MVESLVDGVLMWQVACEFMASSRKLAPQGFTPIQAWERLSEFLAPFPLVTPAASAFAQARRLHVESGVALWDALLAGACIDAGVARLYTEDVPAGRIDGLEVVNPFR